MPPQPCEITNHTHRHPTRNARHGYKFAFSVNGTPKFRGTLKKYRCVCKTDAGVQCKRTTVIGVNYCYQHLKKHFKLRIKPSNIPNAGLGLFACDPAKGEYAVIFKENDRICDYGGETVSGNVIDQRYGDKTAPYAIKVNQSNDIYEDASIKRGVGAMANHANVESQQNARLSTNFNTALLKANTYILNNEEILVNYGDEYNFNDPETSADTTYGVVL